MMQQKPHHISWAMLFFERYFLPIFLAGSLAFFASAFTLWVTVYDLTGAVRNNTDDIHAMKIELNAIRSGSVPRTELLETLKRIEQQFEIMMLKASAEKTKAAGKS